MTAQSSTLTQSRRKGGSVILRALARVASCIVTMLQFLIAFGLGAVAVYTAGFTVHTIGITPDRHSVLIGVLINVAIAAFPIFFCLKHLGRIDKRLNQYI